MLQLNSRQSIFVFGAEYSVLQCGAEARLQNTFWFESILADIKVGWLDVFSPMTPAAQR